MKKQALVVVLVLALSLVAAAAAQAGRPGEPQNRARLRERIADLYIIRLTRALALTEDQAARVYPLLTRAEREKAGLQEGLALDMRDLQAALAAGRVDEGKVGETVARARAARRAIRDKDDEVEAALDAVLTPVQKARYLIFTVEFLRGVGESLERARGMRAPVKRNP